jgi:hypothetical protein
MINGYHRPKGHPDRTIEDVENDIRMDQVRNRVEHKLSIMPHKDFGGLRVAVVFKPRGKFIGK